MTILVLGGTRFVGKYFVEMAISRGHQVTLFNRGRSNPNLFDGLEQIVGDRGVDLSALEGRTWDAVFDTSGYFPRVVGLAAQALKGNVKSYLFISSISVYKEADTEIQNEDSEVATLAGTYIEEINFETYGALKAVCEEIIQAVFGAGALIVRPGLIVGPGDYSDRFTYWPVRMHRAGNVLIPDIKDQLVQIIDVRDLAYWCLTLLENKVGGVFNATGPLTPYRFEEVVFACAEGCSANLIWVDGQFLDEHGVQPWSDIPLALDLASSDSGLGAIDVSRAVAKGLEFRPLKEIVEGTRTWALSRPENHEWRAGLSPEREANLLREWEGRRVDSTK